MRRAVLLIVVWLVGLVSVMPSVAAAHRQPPVHMSVTVASTEVRALKTAVFYVRARNESQHTLRRLDIGSSLVIAGDPENFGGNWSPSLGRCGAAGGTEYCGIRDLGAGEERTWTVRVHVPSHLGGPSGPSTVGRSVGLVAFVDSNRKQKRTISNTPRATVRIVSVLGSLPLTGAPVAGELLVAGLMIAVGAALLGFSRAAGVGATKRA